MSSRLGNYRKANILETLIFGIYTNKRMLYCPWETHFYVFMLKYPYFEKFFEEISLKKFPTIFFVRILPI